MAVGRAPGWIDEGFAHYARRLPRQNALELVVVSSKRRQTDEESLLAAVRAKETLVVLDRRGESFTSEQLAALLADWRMSGCDVALAIGGQAGFGDASRQRADHSLSLSAMTFPHQLVRIMVAEQIYRAWTILSGHPYHSAC